MISIRLYKYDKNQESNGYRGEELTKYILQGASNHEDITQELDTSAITLMGYPIGKAFTPESKFIIDICEFDNIVETLHRIVEEDAVQMPVLSDENYFTHFITFTEPSVVAQKRVVDNIAVTYKLKDVSLETRVSYDLATLNGFKQETDVITPIQNFGHWEGGVTPPFSPSTNGEYFGKQFEFDGNLTITINGTETNLRYVQIEEETTATLNIPKLLVRGGKNRSKDLTAGLPVSITVVIEETDLAGNPIGDGEPEYINILENSDLGDIYGAKKRLSADRYEWLTEYISPSHDKGYGNYSSFRKYTDQYAPTPDYHPTITLTPNHQYNIQIRLYDFVNVVDIPFAGTNADWTYHSTTPIKTLLTTYTFYQGRVVGDTSSQSISVNENTYNQNATIITYTANNIQAVLSQGVPYSALNLIRKAILNSALFEKTEGLPVGDINSQNQTTGAYDYDCPFYIDPAFINELSTTQIVESFFQNKNLWEVFIEAGNYIHAIPELKFGASEKFMLTFNRLGQTQEGVDGGTRTSLLNSQSVDDYISATNSYVSNLVQLGGFIDEWVVAKTTSDDALVYNDTAEIITSLPILELLSLEIKCNSDNYAPTIINGSVGDATQYIYEKNIYNLLSIRFNDVPNKGIAMYYNLGENRIEGGNYQLPVVTTDIYNDYTIKKLIYVALTGNYPTNMAGKIDGVWTNIKVSDFSFHIKYRTKGDVRQTHSRPDLRKFLLNTSWDKIPQHYQINNQTDILVDSQKFGQNMYGKLLRTGNNEYTENEWLASYFNTRHKGEIRRINGEIYYVAKVDNIYYADHIESTVVYSKDYNELSNVIGIPSEPRFYEISEQSQIQRTVAINDYFLITMDATKIASEVKTAGYISYATQVRALILGKISSIDKNYFPRYAVTAFKGDTTTGVVAQIFGDPSLYVEVMSPINAYSSGNTLTLAWNMRDNFSAGDKLGTATAPSSGGVDKVYTPMTAVQYTDKYGKASLFDFFILSSYDIDDETDSFNKIRDLPVSPISAKQGEAGKTYIGDLVEYSETGIFSTNVKDLTADYNARGLTLLKDCREALAFNYNLIALTDSDTFITSPFLFTPDKTNATVVCVREEINKFSNGYINTSALVNFTQIVGGVSTTIVPHKLTTNDLWVLGENDVYGHYSTYGFGINMSQILDYVAHPMKGTTYINNPVRAIAICYDFDLNRAQNPFVIARNIPQDSTPDEAIRNWIFAPPSKTYFNRTE